MEITPEFSAASRQFYLAYLNSPAWRQRRNRSLKLAGWQCSRCPSKRGLEVHHLSYERLGGEWDGDLEVLCETCHRAEHLQAPEQTSLGVYLAIASAAVQDDPMAAIADLSEDVKRRCVALKIPLRHERIHAALSVVIGNRLQTPAAAPVAPDRPADVRAVTHAEAREWLCRLEAGGVDVRSIFKAMPSGPQRRGERVIDIYGAVPAPEWDDR